MRKMNCLEVLIALRICVEKPNYKVGVFTKTAQDAQRIYDKIICDICDDEEVHSTVEICRSSWYDQRIVFKNGSYIKCLSANENARGHRFNRVLYCDGIDHETILTVVHNTEFEYVEGKNHEQEKGN